MEGETISMQEIFRYKMTGRNEDGTVIGHFEPTGIRPKFLVEAVSYGISLPPELFQPDSKLG